MSRYPDPSTVNWSVGLQQVPTYINTVTHGVVMNLLLLAIGIIIASNYWFIKRDFPGALAVGSFVAWTVGLLLWFAGILGNFNFVFLTAVMIGTAIYVIFATNQN